MFFVERHSSTFTPHVIGRLFRGASFALVSLAMLAMPGVAQAQGGERARSDAPDSVLARLLPPALRSAVLASSPALTVRRAEVSAAEARRAAAGFARPATLSVESEDARNGRLDQGSSRVDVSREFLSGARRRGELAVGDAGVRVARVALAAAERQVLAQAAQALYGATGWRTVARRLAAQDSLLLSAEASVRARFSVGDARYVDVLRLRTERLRVQSDRAAAETESDAAAIALVALAGGDSVALRAASDAASSLDSAARGASATARDVSMSIALPEAPSLDSLLVLAADVRFADARLAQTAAQRQLLLARQRPAFSASLGLQRVGADGDRGPGYGPVLAAGMSLPFTAGRANRAALGAVDQQAIAVGVARTATIATVRAALTAGRVRYEAARRRAAAFDAALLRAAREERESALAAYRTSDLSLLELLDFERALSRAEIDRTRATLDALSSLTDLLSGAPSLGATLLGTPSSETASARSSDDR